MRFEDQDGDAAYAGFRSQRIAVRERANAEEMRIRDSIHVMLRDLNHLVHNFEHGEPIDANQIALKGMQIGANIAIVQDMRAAAAVPTRELVPA